MIRPSLIMLWVACVVFLVVGFFAVDLSGWYLGGVGVCCGAAALYLDRRPVSQRH